MGVPSETRDRYHDELVAEMHDLGMYRRVAICRGRRHLGVHHARGAHARWSTAGARPPSAPRLPHQHPPCVEDDPHVGRRALSRLRPVWKEYVPSGHCRRHRRLSGVAPPVGADWPRRTGNHDWLLRTGQWPRRRRRVRGEDLRCARCRRVAGALAGEVAVMDLGVVLRAQQCRVEQGGAAAVSPMDHVAGVAPTGGHRAPRPAAALVARNEGGRWPRVKRRRRRPTSSGSPPPPSTIGMISASQAIRRTTPGDKTSPVSVVP